jgi:hypothetical protein
MEASQLGDQPVPRLDEEVEGVAEHHVVAELGDLRGMERLDRPGRRERHERGRAHLAVGRVDRAGAGGAVARRDLEG